MPAAVARPADVTKHKKTLQNMDYEKAQLFSFKKST